MHAFSAFDSYTYVFALRERTFPFATAKESADRAQTLLAKVPADQYPALAEMTTHHILQPHYDHDHEYEFGSSAEGEPAPAAAKFQAFFFMELGAKDPSALTE